MYKSGLICLLLYHAASVKFLAKSLKLHKTMSACVLHKVSVYIPEED